MYRSLCLANFLRIKLRSTVFSLLHACLANFVTCTYDYPFRYGNTSVVDIGYFEENGVLVTRGNSRDLINQMNVEECELGEIFELDVCSELG